MSHRITEKMLENLVAAINEATGMPSTKWTRHEGNRITSNEGHYCLYSCLGVCSLVQIVGENGGERTVLHAATKGELYGKMQAFREGLRVARETTKQGN